MKKGPVTGSPQHLLTNQKVSDYLSAMRTTLSLKPF